MDRHDVPGAGAQEVAEAHVSDLRVAGKYHVQFFSYWFDEHDGAVFCFARAPGTEAMTSVHKESHGLVPSEIIEVSENDVLRFLGSVQDPADASEITSPFRTIAFTDLVGSTELLDKLGQSEYMLLLTEHDLILRKGLVRFNGREVKHTGDGILASFDDVEAALNWALSIRDIFSNRDDMQIRLGFAAGEPVDHNDDIFGAAVTMASRLCETASPGHILVSDIVHDLCSDSGFEFGDGVDQTLRGFSKPIKVFELLGTIQ